MFCDRLRLFSLIAEMFFHLFIFFTLAWPWCEMNSFPGNMLKLPLHILLYITHWLPYKVRYFHTLYSHVCTASSHSDIKLFWSPFLSFICRNHPLLLQRFWHTIRGYTRWEWLRRCLKAQPIWTLFPTVPFLNHHLMSTANVPYLSYTCPHFSLLPSADVSRSPPFHFSLQSQIIFQE